MNWEQILEAKLDEPAVKSSLKQLGDSEILRLDASIVDDWRPLKRKCLTFIDEDDMNWLNGEVDGIKECIRNLWEDVDTVDNKLEELLLDVQHLGWALYQY